MKSIFVYRVFVFVLASLCLISYPYAQNDSNIPRLQKIINIDNWNHWLQAKEYDTGQMLIESCDDQSQGANQVRCKSYPEEKYMQFYNFSGSRQDWMDYFNRCVNFGMSNDLLSNGALVILSLYSMLTMALPIGAMKYVELATYLPKTVRRMKATRVGRVGVSFTDALLPLALISLSYEMLILGLNEVLGKAGKGQASPEEILRELGSQGFFDIYPNFPTEKALSSLLILQLLLSEGRNQHFKKNDDMRFLAKMLDVCEYVMSDRLTLQNRMNARKIALTPNIKDLFLEEPGPELSSCSQGCHSIGSNHAAQAIIWKSSVPKTGHVDPGFISIKELQKYIDEKTYRTQQ